MVDSIDICNGDVLSKMNPSNNTNTGKIAEALLELENIKLKFNTQSNHFIELGG